eukprot:524579-Prymnesium_polylepis.2
MAFTLPLTSTRQLSSSGERKFARPVERRSSYCAGSTSHGAGSTHRCSRACGARESAKGNAAHREQLMAKALRHKFCNLTLQSDAAMHLPPCRRSMSGEHVHACDWDSGTMHKQAGVPHGPGWARASPP